MVSACLARGGELFLVHIDHDLLVGDEVPRDADTCQPDTARADDDQLVVGRNRLCLADGAVGGDARAGERAGIVRIDAGDIH